MFAPHWMSTYNIHYNWLQCLHLTECQAQLVLTFSSSTFLPFILLLLAFPLRPGMIRIYLLTITIYRVIIIISLFFLAIMWLQNWVCQFVYFMYVLTLFVCLLLWISVYSPQLLYCHLPTLTSCCNVLTLDRCAPLSWNWSWPLRDGKLVMPMLSPDNDNDNDNADDDN